MTEAHRAYPRDCPRCGTRECWGRFAILSCKAVIDGKNVIDEAIELLDGKYAPQTSVVDEVARPELMVCNWGGDILVPWEADKDKRPRARGGPRDGMTWPFTIGSCSAMHGECTTCVRQVVDDRGATKLKICAATWRRQHGPTPEDFRHSKASYCDRHAKQFAAAPIVVPEFGTAEEALAWLDRITEERTAS